MSSSENHPRKEALSSDPEVLKRQVLQLSAHVRELEQELKGSISAGGGHSQREMKVLAEQLARQAMLLERDEHVARELQKNLRPLLAHEPEGLRFAISCKPGTRVGGDFYDIINLSDKFVALLIADVSGYGLPAAVIMATGRLAFRTHTANQLSPRKVMEDVNRTMLRSTLAGHYLTAFLAVLDTELLTLQYVNASHCPPLVLRDGQVIPLDTQGFFVGMFEEPQYEQKGTQLEKNDKLFFYTDGLLRGFNGGEREDSQKMMLKFLAENSGLAIGELVGRLAESKAQPEDDVALMGLELLAEKAKSKSIEFSSIPSELAHAENAILPVLTNKGYGERALFAVKLALEEAAINAIKHGNQLDDTKKVTVTFSIDDERAVITVKDMGEGFDVDTVPDPTMDENLTASSGRGLALIRAYMDEVRHNATGTAITMVKYAPWVAARKPH